MKTSCQEEPWRRPATCMRRPPHRTPESNRPSLLASWACAPCRGSLSAGPRERTINRPAVARVGASCPPLFSREPPRERGESAPAGRFTSRQGRADSHRGLVWARQSSLALRVRSCSARGRGWLSACLEFGSGICGEVGWRAGRAGQSGSLSAPLEVLTRGWGSGGGVAGGRVMSWAGHDVGACAGTGSRAPLGRLLSSLADRCACQSCPRLPLTTIARWSFPRSDTA
jgi:hypothetical protein